MSCENDEDIAVLAEPHGELSSESLSTSDVTARFHITTGDVTDPGSVHALQTAHKALTIRMQELEEENKRLKLNFRIQAKKLQQHHSGSSSLPHIPHLSGSLKTRNPHSNDSGFGSSGADKKMDTKLIAGIEAMHKREVESKDREINAMQKEVYRLMGENEKLKEKLKQTTVSPTVVGEVEGLKKRNSALEENNEQLLKKNAVLEKQSKATKKDLFNLNKDFSEHKQECQELLRRKDLDIKTYHQKFVESEKKIVQLKQVQKIPSMRNTAQNVSPTSMLSQGKSPDETLLQALKNVNEYKGEMKDILKTVLQHQQIIKGFEKRKKTSVAPTRNTSLSVARRQNVPSGDIATGYRDDGMFSDTDDEEVRMPVLDIANDMEVPKSLRTEKKDNVEKNKIDFQISGDSDVYCFPDPNRKYMTGSDKYSSANTMTNARPNPEGMPCTGPNEVENLGGNVYTLPTGNDFSLSLNGLAVGQATDNSEADLLRRSSGSPKICPTCHLSFPGSMPTEDFQLHILDCNPSSTGFDMEMNEVKGYERVCPMCNAVYPAAVPQIEYEQHVMHHFDNDGTNDFIMT